MKEVTSQSHCDHSFMGGHNLDILRPLNYSNYRTKL